MSTTITFDYGAYDGRPTLDTTPEDTESLDFGAYDGRPSVYPETAAGTAVPVFEHYYRMRRTA